jgi:NADP-dependent 3-hydroxy acid dehydrogenase YdfG
MNRLQFETINQQVIVITGASSGIGFPTARLAAEKEAKVILGGEQALHKLGRIDTWVEQPPISLFESPRW